MLHQSEAAMRREPAPNSGCAGQVVVSVTEFDFPKAFTAATDLIEIAMLPGGNRLISLALISTIAGANTATVKLLDGEFGDSINARALTGATIATGSVQNATLTADLKDAIAIKPAKNTGIGIQLTADVAAGGGTLTLVAKYAA